MAVISGIARARDAIMLRVMGREGPLLSYFSKHPFMNPGKGRSEFTAKKLSFDRQEIYRVAVAFDVSNTTEAQGAQCHSTPE